MDHEDFSAIDKVKIRVEEIARKPEIPDGEAKFHYGAPYTLTREK